MTKAAINLRSAIIFLIIFISLVVFFLLPLPSHAASPSVVINEVMPHPSTGSDWVEIYNPGGTGVDLTGWTLSDSSTTIATLSGIIQAGDFLSIDVSNRLNNSGDQVHLKDQTGTEIDSYTYTTDPGADVSFGRSPDGGSFTTLSPTKDTSNNSASSVATPTPTPTPSPTVLPTPSPTPTSTPSPNSSITISNVPSNINSDDVFSTTVNLSSPNNPNTIFYLKGAFYIDGSTNYFGKTLVNGNWVKNSSGYNSQLEIITDGSGNWQGIIQVMPDDSDSGFTGTGSYNFKVAKYTSSGNLSWSNSTSLTITLTDNPMDTTEASSSATLTQSDSTTASGSAIPVTNNLVNKIASPSGIATVSGIKESKNPPFESSKNFNWYLVGGAIAIGLSLLIVLNPLRFLPKNLKIRIIKIWSNKLTTLRKLNSLPQNFLKNLKIKAG